MKPTPKCRHTTSSDGIEIKPCLACQPTPEEKCGPMKCGICGMITTLGINHKCLRDESSPSPEARVDGETSDGYHTFNELYEHRVLLWINLCLTVPIQCYVVEEHYAGWFLLGMGTANGQISYHCQNKYLHLVKNIKREHPEFDGHTSKQVIERLLAKAAHENGCEARVDWEKEARELVSSHKCSDPDCTLIDRVASALSAAFEKGREAR